jgi:hypothetical protein
MHYGCNTGDIVSFMAAKKKPVQKKAVAKKAPAKKAAGKTAAAKKATTPAQAKKKPGRPAKAKQIESVEAEVNDVVDSVEEAVTEARELITSVSGIAPQAAFSYVAELITANDIKSKTLRKRVLAWFKRP